MISTDIYLLKTTKILVIKRWTTMSLFHVPYWSGTIQGT